ncbi:MAG: type II toxin-antitoxin system death-on-curing family toxin [bacterium]|nr:type II toxin-antitoxin system death-on-curing family toxin [bacterium]
MGKTIFLTLEQVLFIHTTQIDNYGGSDDLRDLGLLESAILRSQSTFSGRDLYSSVFEKSAAYAHSLILNHPFVDANKRTAIVSALTFLEINGHTVSMSQKEIIDGCLKIESKKWNIGKISKWLKTHTSN